VIRGSATMEYRLQSRWLTESAGDKGDSPFSQPERPAVKLKVMAVFVV